MNEVSKDANPMDVFRAKVIKRLQDDIGELMPEEALVGLVEKAVQESFFEPVIERDVYGKERKREASWFIQEVAKQAEPLIKKAVADWIKDHEDEIKQAVDKFLADQSLMIVTLEAMRQHTQSDIFNATAEIVRQIKQGY